ncbi:hypothetical protein SOVF_078340 [Spinacia oleracea]|uniref:UV-B-induced protein At3g17800, chloroplastic n=1 Tax=Spinacia oleracea TaxID=3562 RepID=A0A9R0HXA3_SPIOL|nr:UV-B-induced protein At3g17800, chloroplastic-like [Spinacia oleracea]KNA17639.1 hypothetical protein SOVF_078340 [Spinacia oleracea]
MEAAATVLRLPLRPSISGSNGKNSIRFTTNFRLSKSTSPYNVKLGVGRWSSRSMKSLVVRASKSSNSFESTGHIAPLQLESPVGQFLSQILVSHPHLVPAAVEQQLEQLQTDSEAGKQKEEPSATGTDLVLYRRIAEVKANERRKVLEEILYTLVVQKFMDANISLIPSISPSSADRVDMWPSLDGKLEDVHSPEAYEMIQNHLALILGNRLEDSTSVAQISKLRVGQVYAASVMFGYFLKRIDQRFQLEKAMKILPEHIDGNENDVIMEDGTTHMASNHQDEAQLHPEVSSSWAAGGFDQGTTSSRLKSYVMAFDAETLARYATIRSKEAVSIIEKHTEALFGKPEITMTPQGTIDSSKDELIKIGFGGLRRLVLEAVTFGSYLWDVETYVESRHRFVLN